MSDVRRLDEVSIFNDKLTFLIPHEWIEVDSGEDGTYLYQVPDVRSGWFRVSLITISNVARPAERLAELFSNHENVSANETTGNLIGRTETIRNGAEPRCIFSTGSLAGAYLQTVFVRQFSPSPFCRKF